MATTIRGALFFVQTIRWEPVFDTEEMELKNVHFSCPVSKPGAPVKAFTNRDAADDYCRRKEEEARGRHNPYLPNPNPFRFGEGLKDQTSLPEGILCDWLLDAGLSPPRARKQGGRNWQAWWKAERVRMTSEQRNKVWEALDKVRFYRVVEL
jgi:hypothetical protein